MSDLYPFENNFLELHGLQYHYLDEGQGDPVVMVHGNPSWSFYYRDLVKAAEKCTAQVIHPGLPRDRSAKDIDKWIARGSKYN